MIILLVLRRERLLLPHLLPLLPLLAVIAGEVLSEAVDPQVLALLLLWPGLFFFRLLLLLA